MSVVGVITMGVLFALLLLRVPVGAAMAAVGFTGLVYLSGVTSALGVLATSTYSSLSSYALSVVPLFILMGYFAFYAGLKISIEEFP